MSTAIIRKTDDLEIGGYRADAGAARPGAGQPRSGHPGARRPARPPAEQRRGDLGRRRRRRLDLDGENNVGFSVNRYDSLYGVPIRYSLDPAIEAEAPRIDIAQTRVDGRAEIDTGVGFLDIVRLRGGYSDYRHFELEEDGAIGTALRLHRL